MTEFVRFPLPWHWEGLDEGEFQRRLRDLGAWVNWFVARYHLVRKVPACWYLHPGLLDELKALWYYHQEVTAPLVPLIEPERVGDAVEPEEPEVSARMNQDWHEARWRFITGPLADAAGYRDCVAKGRHVADARAADVQVFAKTASAGLEEAIDASQAAR